MVHAGITAPMRKIGPHSRPDKLQIVDGRLAEGKLMARMREELTAHLGGKPSATQRILIDRIAALSLRLHLMDRESARSGEMSERNGRSYLGRLADHVPGSGRAS
jgi:hypothetical protein